MPRSSKSFLFPDVNVWLALTYEGHVHHSSARQWFERIDDESRLCFCRFTQISFLRLLTTEAVMGDDAVLNQSEAWRMYDRWVDDGGAVFLEEPPTIESSFRSLSSKSHPAPKDWADSYLAAFAATSGIKLVTFDKALATRVREPILLK